jgi:hypothetical protein
LATLSLRGLSKLFGLVEAIAAIDIEVVEHEFVRRHHGRNPAGPK